LGSQPSSRTEGKPAVRNDRGDRGNVGIIRSPIRASILPDRSRVMCSCRSITAPGPVARSAPLRLLMPSPTAAAALRSSPRPAGRTNAQNPARRSSPANSTLRNWRMRSARIISPTWHERGLRPPLSGPSKRRAQSLYCAVARYEWRNALIALYGLLPARLLQASDGAQPAALGSRDIDRTRVNCVTTNRACHLR
jgi:hypothetical protein